MRDAKSDEDYLEEEDPLFLDEEVMSAVRLDDGRALRRLLGDGRWIMGESASAKTAETNPVLLAVASGASESLAVFLEETDCEKWLFDGFSIAHWAAAFGNIEALRLFVEKGGSVRSRGGETGGGTGKTPLAIALSRGDERMALFLIEKEREEFSRIRRKQMKQGEKLPRERGMGAFAHGIARWVEAIREGDRLFAASQAALLRAAAAEGVQADGDTDTLGIMAAFVAQDEPEIRRGMVSLALECGAGFGGPVAEWTATLSGSGGAWEGAFARRDPLLFDLLAEAQTPLSDEDSANWTKAALRSALNGAKARRNDSRWREIMTDLCFRHGLSTFPLNSREKRGEASAIAWLTTKSPDERERIVRTAKALSEGQKETSETSESLKALRLFNRTGPSAAAAKAMTEFVASSLGKDAQSLWQEIFDRRDGDAAEIMEAGGIPFEREKEALAGLLSSLPLVCGPSEFPSSEKDDSRWLEFAKRACERNGMRGCVATSSIRASDFASEWIGAASRDEREAAERSIEARRFSWDGLSNLRLLIAEKAAPSVLEEAAVFVERTTSARPYADGKASAAECAWKKIAGEYPKTLAELAFALASPRMLELAELKESVPEEAKRGLARTAVLAAARAGKSAEEMARSPFGLSSDGAEWLMRQVIAAGLPESAARAAAFGPMGKAEAVSVEESVELWEASKSAATPRSRRL